MYYLSFTEIGSLWSNEQYTNIGSDNGLVPNKRQTFIRTDGGQICWRIYASLGLDELQQNSWPPNHHLNQC